MASPRSARATVTLAATGDKGDARRRAMRAVRAAIGRLGIADDDRRIIQMEVTGKASMADMDAQDLGRLLDHLNRGATRAGQRSHAGKVRALWWTLYWLGAGDRSDGRAIDAFVKRQTGVDALRFLDHRQAHAVIEALKDWAARLGVEWPHPPSSIADRRAVATAIWRRLALIEPVGGDTMVVFLAAGIGCTTDASAWSTRTWDDAIRFLGKHLRRKLGTA